MTHYASGRIAFPPGAARAGGFLAKLPPFPMQHQLLQVIALMDGFNLYHAVHDLKEPRLKWCGTSALVRQFLLADEALAETRYYTANPIHLAKEVQNRHAAYVAAIQAQCDGQFTVQRGHFREKPVQINFNNDGVSVRVRKKGAREEKETDVRIAVDMMDIAMRGQCDALALVSGDSDQIPAIERVLERFPQIQRFIILLPPGQKSEHLRQLAEKYPGRVRVSQIKRAHVENSRMPDEFTDSNGKTHRAPKEYRDDHS